MGPDEAQEIAERDQLWASLRNIRQEIARIANEESPLQGSQAGVVRLLARIVLAEIDFRDRHGSDDATADR